MTINLRDYLAANERKYSYRIKTVVPIDENILDRIERYLAKYLPISIGKVNKTMFQTNPLDFPGIDHAEVYFIDITTALPASSYVLQQDIRMALKIPEKYIVVRGENDPLELETQRLNANMDIDDQAKTKNLSPEAVLNHGDYPEANVHSGEDFYGDKFNANLAQHLKRIADKRNEELNAIVKAPFNWLDLPENELSPKQDTNNFNKDIKPSIEPEKSKGAIQQSMGTRGNANNNTETYKKLFKDKNGNTEIISSTVSAVQKKG